jgi:TIR domain
VGKRTKAGIVDVLLASAAGGDLADRTRRHLVAAGHVVRPDGRRDVEGCGALVVAVGAQLDPEGLVDLMQVLADARRLSIRLVGVTDCPPEKHPPAIGALQLETTWIELGEDGSALAAALATEGEVHDPETYRVRVFVSYSRRDEALVTPLVEELRARRVEVWRDTDSIPGGDTWRASIEGGIRACDAVIVFLSPQVVKNPNVVLAELGVAQSMDKRIVPVRIKRMPALPDGFGLILSGTHTIDLFPDYDAGVARLVKDLGGDDGRRRLRGVLQRGRRAAQHARRFAEQHDLARHAAEVGASQRAETTRQKVQNAELDARQAAARREYIDRTMRLLTDGMKELQASTEMTAAQYKLDVQPRMMRIIGNLEAGRPVEADVAFTTRHDQLVRDLERLVTEFDQLFDRITRDETSGLEHSFRRLNDAWSNTVNSALRWLQVSLPD